MVSPPSAVGSSTELVWSEVSGASRFYMVSSVPMDLALTDRNNHLQPTEVTPIAQGLNTE